MIDAIARRYEGFRAGDRVVLTGGPYEGTPGVFLKLGDDVNWAEIEEAYRGVRSHPVQWLGLDFAGKSAAPVT